MQNAKVSISPATENAPTTIDFQSLAAGLSPYFLPRLLQLFLPRTSTLGPDQQWFGPHFYLGYRVVQISVLLQTRTDFAEAHAKFHPAAVKFKSILL